MHGTDGDLGACISRPIISAAGLEGWPEGPLVEWPLEVLEVFFETLGVLVRHEGREQ